MLIFSIVSYHSTLYSGLSIQQEKVKEATWSQAKENRSKLGTGVVQSRPQMGTRPEGCGGFPTNCGFQKKSENSLKDVLCSNRNLYRACVLQEIN